jgi:FemAB-related protein (PEP-CTERM system-associated)
MPALPTPSTTAPGVRLLTGPALADALPGLIEFLHRNDTAHPAHHPLWLFVLKEGLGHVPYVLEARHARRTTGCLPLAFVRSTLFGRFLVSLPYLNTAGVIADDDGTRRALIDRAIELADELDVRHLELRHESAIVHLRLNGTRTDKVHMRLPLPSFPGPLWEEFPSKVRNQVRKGEKSGLTVQFGSFDLLDEFYAVFSHNMRDLGTPVYGRKLFQAVLRYFPESAELCVVRLGTKPVAGALVVHGKGISEVPSASSLREFNSLCANMFMYWNLLDRAIERGQSLLDFGRSTRGSNSYKFKKQWGAEESPAVWQYSHRGEAADLQPDNPKYGRLVQIWKRLPVSVTRVIGPAIVRGIP